MRKGTCNRVSISLACLLGLALLLSAGTALAKKPVPPDPDPDVTGVIYFEDEDGGLAYVPADGSEDPTALDVPAGEISSSLHGDEYWVLYAAEVGGKDPDGITPLRELFVEAVDGSTTTAIQLTEYTSLSLSRSTYPAPVFAWGPDDDTVVFVAVEWANDGDGDYATGAGIYEISLTWSADGASVTAGSPVKLAPCQWRTVVATGETFFRYGPALSWSPDGAALTTGFYDPDTQETVVVMVDLTDGDVTRLVEGAAYPTYPLWSMDGDWIYYDASDWSGIRRVSVDGVDDEEVLDPEDSRKFIYDALGPMRWSPDGGAFAYRHKSVKLGRLPQDAVTTNEIATHDLTSGQSTILCEGLRALAWRP